MSPNSDATAAGALHRLLVESVTEYAIYALDVEGRVVTWNPGAERVKGYTPSEIIGRHFSVFFTEEDRQSGKAERELELARKDGRFEEESWRVRKDGRRFWANVVITPLRDESGDVIGFAKVTRDLTDRRNAEQRALELAAANAAREEAERRSEELAELTSQLQQQAVELELQTEEAQALSEQLEFSNDELQAAADKANLASERLTATLATLQRSETLLKEAQSSAMLGSWEWDVGANRITWSDELYRIYGLPIGVDVDYETFLAYVHPDDRPVVGAAVQRSYTSGEPFSFEHRIVRTDNVTRTMHARGRVLRDELGNTTHMLGSGQDITERKRAELEREALLQRETVARLEAEEARVRADEANLAKSQFLAMMSHELRTPLNAIIGYVDLLDLGIRGPVSDVQMQDLARVRIAAAHLLTLINALLNHARVESGQVEYRKVPVPIDGMLHEVEPFVLPQVASRGLSYTCNACSSSLVALADREKTLQVLLNLVSNAVKFTDSGDVTVEATAIGESSLAIHVRDTGPGIPSEKLDHIFEPFVQLNPTLTSTERQGVGLGLAISRDLARGMGGDLIASSEVGRGSTFTLILPRATSGESEQARSA